MPILQLRDGLSAARAIALSISILGFNSDLLGAAELNALVWCDNADPDLLRHDQEEAMALADCCVVMNRGRIEDIGSAERIYARPASRFTAAFMGDSTAIEGTVAEAKPARTGGSLCQ